MATISARWCRLIAGLCGAVTLAMITAVPAAAEGQILGADAPEAVDGSYLVVIKDSASPKSASARTAAALTGKYGGQVTAAWQSALNGFAVHLSAQQARRLAADQRVAYVAQDALVHADTTTQLNPPSWGLDRIDQRNLPLSASYSHVIAASNVHAYVIDTGVRTTHATFGGRATWGFNAVDGNNTDCNGHGTHVAGTIGGAQYGVTKGVALVAVKVLDCNGNGTTSQVVSGVNWVTGHAIKPAVANMSLGGSVQAPLDNAVRNSIASGITYSIASGNDSTSSVKVDACQKSPARVAEAITVNNSTITDVRHVSSNVGTCTTMFAPGTNITSSWNTSDTATNVLTGTSMAAPHVAGAAALYLATAPSATPATVKAALIAKSTPNKITDPGTGSPNRLLFTDPFTVVIINPGTKTYPDLDTIHLQLTAVGATEPYTWSATGLGPVLQIGPTTGVITGRPGPGTFNITVTTTPTSGNAGRASFTIVVFRECRTC